MRRRFALGALGAVLVVCVVLLGIALDRPDPFASPAAVVAAIVAVLAVYGLAAIVVLRSRSLGRSAFAIVLVVAVVARLALAVQPPELSDDIYRYVWDGRVQAAGINPYRHAPESPALAQLRDVEIYENVNRRFAPTIYPPAAQALFRGTYAVYADSVVWTKVVFVGVDALAILLLGLLLHRSGRPPERALLYAWHPLALIEVGHSGHVDVAAVTLLLGTLLLLGRKRVVAAGVVLAAAVLVKFYALAVLPALLAGSRRAAIKLVTALVAAAGLAYLPFIEVGTRVLGYLPGYLEEEGFDSGARFYALRLTGLEGATAAALYQTLAAALLGIVAIAVWRRGAQAEGAALLLLVTLLVATPAYPWYGLLPLALLPFAGPRVLVAGSVLAGTMLLLYVQQKAPGNPEWPLHVVWGGGSLALGIAGLSALRERLPRGRVVHAS
ncbi:MAG: glycosyltransferase 87 family protein [Actinomycetota bacterium]|nr:glycosyltransferase 87 family protein [Actinomycetota bacterium]